MEIMDAANPPSHRLAPLFNYFYCRGGRQQLVDIEPRQALEIATSYGLCTAPLHTDRYTVTDALRRPSEAAANDAQSHRILSSPGSPAMRSFWFERLVHPDRVGEWRAAISAGIPILFGFYATDAYWRMNSGASRLVLSGAEIGRNGHVAVAVGIAADGFVVQDSRGQAFGRNGQWLIPFALLVGPLVVEAWVVRRINYD